MHVYAYAAVMLSDAQQLERRTAIVRILRDGRVPRQEDLVRLLKKAGFEVTQSSISRDLRDLGVLKANGRYALPPDEVARANGDNRIAIIIPCHRVIGSNGELVGYGGGLWRKKKLLELEGRGETLPLFDVT